MTNRFFDNITISKDSRLLIALTIIISFIGILLSSTVPIVLKTVIDKIVAGSSFSIFYILLFGVTFFLSNFLLELRWWAYSNADEKNFSDHIFKVIKSQPNASAIRLHKSALGNRIFVSTIFFTLIPIIIEVILGSIVVLKFMPYQYSLVYLISAIIQLFFGVFFSFFLNPKFTITRESEVSYFDALSDSNRSNHNLFVSIEEWYLGLKKINMLRSFIKAACIFWPAMAIVILNTKSINDLALNIITIGDIIAINTYILQSSGRIETATLTFRNAILAKNDIHAAFHKSK